MGRFVRQAVTRQNRSDDGNEPNVTNVAQLMNLLFGRIPDLLCGREPIGLQEWKLTFSSREFRDRLCIAA